MALSPMMKQYFKTKSENPDVLLLYRLGDFYEMFYDDALKASKLLDLTLTSRDCGLEERAPMCGVPWHAVDNYIAKLVAAGVKVGICEQMTTPEEAKKSKDIIRRDVVRIFTAGTLVENTILDESKNNYLLSVFCEEDGIGIAWSDISTGEFEFAQCVGSNALMWLVDRLVVVNPAEIICNSAIYKLSCELSVVRQNNVVHFTQYADANFDKDAAASLVNQTFDEEDRGALLSQHYSLCAAGALLGYIAFHGKRSLKHFRTAKSNAPRLLHLDLATRRNLELTEVLRGANTKNRSLLGLINRTSTSMGLRQLRLFLERPLSDGMEINRRLSGVEELASSSVLRDGIAAELKHVQDIKRLAGRVSFGSVRPREVAALGASLARMPALKRLLCKQKSAIIGDILTGIDDFDDIVGLIDRAIADSPPLLVSAGGVIRAGYNAKLDELMQISLTGKDLLTALEVQERESTGIKGLKVRFNRVFGYFIEIPHAQTSSVPFRYTRRQTTASAERYITDELKELEEKILGAESLILSLEQSLYDDLIKTLQDNINRIITAANAVAVLDALNSLADVAVANRFVKPTIGDDVDALEIIEGRHPVVEVNLDGDIFVPNDTALDNSQNKIMVITGPNMAGKSTYMRQVALITLLAHIGSFVPARRATIPVVDRIFTRIGASDDLAGGQSTFMVEMTEVAEILNNATARSLIIMDEVGRGTSTLDGLSIAWAILEYLSKNCGAMTLFSTHYHELTELEGVLSGVKNYRVSVRESNNTIVFLHKIIRGSANRSFGIEVGQMAGLPAEVTKRAKDILKKLEKVNISTQVEKQQEAPTQLSLFASPKNSEIINILKDINIETLSPLKAFDIVQNFSEKAKEL